MINQLIMQNDSNPKSFFQEFVRIIKSKNITITGMYITKNNYIKEITITIKKNNEFYIIDNNNNNNTLINILWIAGIIEPKNRSEIEEKLKSRLISIKTQNRAIALGLDTSLLLINQIVPLVDLIMASYPPFSGTERFPIVVTTQATQYELHHQISSELKKKHYDKDEITNFIIPYKNYNSRGRRGVWGRYMHQIIVERYPHIIIQTRIPNMLTKLNNEDKDYTLANINPTSPVFDNVIFEQFLEFSSLTNLEIIFATTDSNLARIAEQSGITSIYLEQPNNIDDISNNTENSNKLQLSQRKVLWIILTMLYKYDKIKIQYDNTEEEWMLTKNTRGKHANLYFKKNDNEWHYYVLNVDDKVF